MGIPALSDTLRISEIFYSLQGEARFSGMPTVFVRLTGCPLRCHYCDTAYAFSGGERLTLEEILGRVSTYSCQQVTVTGGEPLAQPHCLALLSGLCDRGYQVSLETSGALDIRAVDARVVRVMDLKTPASGESSRNLYDNIHCLGCRDQLKFVICDRQDYEWAKEVITRYRLAERCEILMLTAYQQMDAAQLADWILADRLPVRLQIQLHKCLWGDVAGR